MRYDLNCEIDICRFKHRVASLISRRCIVELTDKKPVRTSSQNKYLHCILGRIRHANRESDRICQTGIFQTAMQPGIICARRIRQADAQGGRKAPVKS